ncbi:MAG: hypothetical protein WCG47_29845 [Dermatophilaceae bacterium]
MGTMRGATGDRLVVTLEDAASRSRVAWLVGMLLMHQQWHFVGLVDGKMKYGSPTFAAPKSWGVLPIGKTACPQQEWAPAMGEALAQLCAEINADGWTEVGCGAQPWEHVYRRAS